MDGLLSPTLLMAAAATCLAGIVRGFAGFGSAMVQGPLFAILFVPAQGVATMAGLGTLASLQLLPGVRRQVQWRQIAPLTVMGLLTVPLGALVLLALEPALMRRIISALVLLLALVLMSGWRYPARPGPWGAAGTGVLSGFINGATGVGGPPVVLYMLAGPNVAATNRANLIAYYTFLNGGTCLTLLAHGVFTMETVWRTLALWPVQVVSLWLGSWLFRHANDALYRRLALLLLLGVALFGLFYRR
jgi:uncharacterized protein